MSCLMWVMGGPGVTLPPDMLSRKEVWLRGVATGVTGPGLTECFMSRATRPSLARMSLLRPLKMSTWNTNNTNINKLYDLVIDNLHHVESIVVVKFSPNSLPK